MTDKNALVAGAIVGSYLTLAILVSLTYYIFIIIAGWKIFTKAGIPGWKSLIPIYNLYLLYKLSDTNFWIWLFIPSFLASFASGFIGEDATNVNPIILVFVIAAVIYCIVGNWKFSKNLATAFNKDTGFAIGLFLLPNVFQLILGFGKAEYKK